METLKLNYRDDDRKAMFVTVEPNATCKRMGYNTQRYYIDFQYKVIKLLYQSIHPQFKTLEFSHTANAKFYGQVRGSQVWITKQQLEKFEKRASKLLKS